MLKFICYAKCTTCKKARSWLDERAMTYEMRDIKGDNPTYDELKDWLKLSKLPIKRFFNTSGILYRELELSQKLPTMTEEECLQLLATDGMLVKRPILVAENAVLVGFKLPEWETLIK
ncbi:MAG: arsenate reductase family protein [Firmicutes bacterium]|nr:arsenate reductase family protein [Bacillota bacterium]